MFSQGHYRMQSAYNLWFLGYPDHAVERAGIATALTQKSASKHMLSEVHYWAAALYELRREPDHVRARAEAALAAASEVGNRVIRFLSECSLGWADAMAGDLEGGIAQMGRWHSRRADNTPVWVLCQLADCLCRMGRIDEGLSTIKESFPIIERTGGRLFESEAHRLKGELLLNQGASKLAQAEQSFRCAIEISRRQKAKSWELRATTSLARLLVKQSKRDEARAMLPEIYNWFTEGFATADLKDAKALLDELNN